MIKNYINKKVFLSILFICTFGSYAQEDMYDYNDNSMATSASRGFFAMYPSLIMNGTYIEGFSFNLAYGGGISKNRYAGSFEIGLAISSYTGGLQFKYEYDLLNKNDLWHLGVDTSILIGGTPDRTRLKIAFVNELGAFVGRSLSQSISAFIRLGILHETLVKGWESYGIDTYLGLGVRYYLKN